MAGKSVAMHGRDHRPGGADPIPNISGGLPWAYTRSDPATGVTIPGTLVATYFSIHDSGGGDRFETSDPSVFANVSTTAFTGSPVWGIQFNTAGTFMVQGSFHWVTQGTSGAAIAAYWTLDSGSAPSFFQFGRVTAMTGDNWSHGAAAPGLPQLSFYEFVSVSPAQIGGVGALYASVASGGSSTVTAQMMVFKISDYVGLHL